MFQEVRVKLQEHQKYNNIQRNKQKYLVSRNYYLITSEIMLSILARFIKFYLIILTSAICSRNLILFETYCIFKKERKEQKRNFLVARVYRNEKIASDLRPDQESTSCCD